MTYRHLLMTNFNVRSPEWSTDKNGNEINTREWLTHRMGLFERYCLPSIASQDTDQFKWLIFIDEKTDAKMLPVIQGYRDAMAGLELIMTPDFGDRKKLRQFLRHATMSRADAPYLITTRLDNDDALATHAMSAIQSAFNEQELEAINLTNGYVLCEGKTYSSSETSNPFISLIERRTARGFLTVRHPRTHGWFGRKMKDKLRQVAGDHYWLRVVHDRNLLNKAKGTEVREADLSKFKLEKPL